MNKEEIQQLLKARLQSQYGLDVNAEDIQLEHPQDPAHGDWSTNVAMAYAKQLQMPPRTLAEALINSLETGGDISKTEVAGPGFINFFINSQAEVNQLNKIDSHFGELTTKKGQTVMVEFGQPNTHKAFHVGHLKSAISGLAICGMLENLGYKVVRANFYGDIGMHVANCTWGAMQQGSLGELQNMDVHQRMKIIDNFYVTGANAYKNSPEAAAEIKEINKQIYAHAETPAVQVYEQLRVWSLEHLNDAFARLGVVYDRQYPESEMVEESMQIVRDHIGDVFEESQGAIIYDGKKAGLTTWVFITSDNHPTYEAKDLALAYKKFQEYDLDLSIITTSVEQRDRFKTIIHALGLIDPKFINKYIHLPFGWLLRNNKKTSSRMGDSVKGMDILNEAEAKAYELITQTKDYSEAEKQKISETVGLAGLKFLILSHEFHKDINYDPEQFISLEGFSGPYLLYALARTQSILTQAGTTEFQAAEFTHDAETKLVKQLLRFPELAEKAADNYAPHLLAIYLYTVAQEFNRFYSEVPVLTAESEAQRATRLKITAATKHVLEKGLHILGIETLQQM